VTLVLGVVVVPALSGVIEAFVAPSWVRIGIGAVAETAFLA
jgi:hypothetical protein